MRPAPSDQEFPFLVARPACVGRPRLPTSSAETNPKPRPMPVRLDLLLTRPAQRPRTRTRARDPTARPAPNRTPTAAKAPSIPPRPVVDPRIGMEHQSPTSRPPRLHLSARDHPGRLRRTPIRTQLRSGPRRHWPRRPQVGAAVVGLSRLVLVDKRVFGLRRTRTTQCVPGGLEACFLLASGAKVGRILL